VTNRSPAALSLSTRRIRKAVQSTIELLESRAYLNGVVFGSPQNISGATAGISPVFVNLDDLNGDGKADLIVANVANGSVPNSVSVMLGNGDGTFGAAQTIAVPSAPLPVAEADLNGDGKLDIVSGNEGTVSVLLNNGNGSFGPPTSYNALTNNHAIAIGDFDHDGHMDIATVGDDANPANNVAILWGNGDGTFSAPTFVTIPHQFLSAITTFNTGPLVNLAITDQQDNRVTVLTPTGSRANPFNTPVDYTVGSAPVSIMSADFNGDGKTDLVTANSSSASVSVLTGRGDGTFNLSAITTAVPGVPGTSGPLKVRVSQLDGDSNPDLLLLLGPGASADAAVLLGNGNGTFHTGTLIATGGAGRDAISAGDLNNDGFTDAVISDQATITVLRNVTNQDTTPPTAAVDVTQPASVLGSATYRFTVTYSDDTQIDATSLGNGNLVVTDPHGNNQAAVLVSSNLGNAPSVTATYQINAPSGSLSAADNGGYTVTANANSVKDANGNALAAGVIGSFQLAVPAPAGNGPNLVASNITANIPSVGVAHTRAKGVAKMTITNSGNVAVKQTILINLYASPDNQIRGNAPVLRSVNKRISLKPGQHVNITFPGFTWPASLNGNYFLVAKVDVNNVVIETNESDNVGISAGKVFNIAPPFVDLKNLGATGIPATLVANKTVTLSLTLKNLGNVTASGPLTVKVLASTDTIESGGDLALATLTPHVSLKAGQTKVIKLHFKVPAIAAGVYHMIIDAALPGDANTGNNIFATAGTFTI
jgi:hypothetical protein